MARNGSGTYAAPANSWNPAVGSTTISSTDWAALLSDLETALTGSIAKDGQTPTSAVIPFANGIKSDTVAEQTSNTGVTVDGVLLKDGVVSTDTINEDTSGSGVTIDGVLLKDSAVSTDTINEKTAAAGVTIDGVLIKDGSVTVTDDIVHSGDANNLISFDTDTQDFQTGGSSRLDISDSGVRFGGANARITTVLDEDDMASDSATSLATQQSIKAYIASQRPDILHYQEQRTSGTAGPSYSADAWRTVALNTEVLDAGGHGSLSSNAVTLAAGTYEAWASAAVTAGGTLIARLRLRDLTGGGTSLIAGTNGGQGAGSPDSVALTLCGVFTLASSSVIELQIYPTENTTGGVTTSSGEVEIYSNLYLRKVA